MEKKESKKTKQNKRKQRSSDGETVEAKHRNRKEKCVRVKEWEAEEERI